ARRPPEPTPLSRSRSNRSASNLAPVPPPPPAPAPPPPPPDFKLRKGLTFLQRQEFRYRETAGEGKSTMLILRCMQLGLAVPERDMESQQNTADAFRKLRTHQQCVPYCNRLDAPAEKDPLSKAQEQKLEKLRTGRARKRPDWSAMMKEVEQGLRLRHVQCNDRSQPLLPSAKVKGQFMYDSEKPNVHNQLLREIQSGVRLKKVKTNDRSRPILEGLRKFRRQLTIEEQAQQAQAQEEVDAAAEPDDLDDIDTLRDDLQSTKQMLALELRNKQAVEKENKRLQARILNLEVELDEERRRKAAAPPADEGGAKRSLEAEKEAEALRGQLSEAGKRAHDLEQRVHEADLQAELLRAELEELRRRNATLERRVSSAGKDQPLRKQPSAKKLNKSMSAVNAAATNAAMPQPDDEEEEETETESEEDEEEEEEDSSEDEEKMAALREKRQAREIKLLSTKVRTLKEKQDTVRKERRALRLALRNQTKALRDERKKYKKLQKEVDKMAKLLKEDDDEDEEEEEEEEAEEEEEEESEEESSTEESEDEESEGELPADAPFDDRKKNFTDRAKRHENILAALKKGNYLLKANVEKVKDDLFKQKELSITMQEDLNSVLAELG
ncbi:Uncharacterized protein GBIM_09632, partial [Gryllus bimaculatus]